VNSKYPHCKIQKIFVHLCLFIDLLKYASALKQIRFLLFYSKLKYQSQRWRIFEDNQLLMFMKGRLIPKPEVRQTQRTCCVRTMSESIPKNKIKL